MQRKESDAVAGVVEMPEDQGFGREVEIVKAFGGLETAVGLELVSGTGNGLLGCVVVGVFLLLLGGGLGLHLLLSHQ